MKRLLVRLQQFAALSSVLVALGVSADDSISLAGKWRFALDRADAGTAESWQERRLAGEVRLPGTLPDQRIGDAPSLQTKWTGGIQDPRWAGNPIYAPYTSSNDFRFPFWLQPETYYVGAAWYQRDFTVPKGWRGKRVVLSLERPHWETRVWVDGVLIGTNNALGTPHEFDLGTLDPGKHTLTVRVDNRLVVDVGHDSHSVTDHTQGNWNGIVGNIELRATPLVWIEEVQVFPDLEKESITVRGFVGNASGAQVATEVEVVAFSPNFSSNLGLAPHATVALTVPATGAVFSAEIRLLPRAPLRWEEFSPRLHNVRVSLPQFRHHVEQSFGFREIGTHGREFLLNGRKTFFRGTLECAIFPKTGHPPTDVESWKRIIRVCKAHGLNMIRFHSWCPPKAAFIAADELGFYYQVEVSSWANSTTTLGDGKPVDAWLYAEAARMVKHYGNHPSFLLMAYGNEPGGKNHSRWLSQWVTFWKEADPRRLHTSGAGWPQIPENEFHVTPDPRIQAWGGGLRSRINARPPETMTDYRDYISERTAPVISHEIGQWCVYPNLQETRKYTGYLKAKNFEIFRDTLRRNHMGHQAGDFLHASGKLQALCYKEDIESALRTREMGGFQLLDLHDFPGQGTALVGVLDPFWDEKGYITASEYKRFCGPTVPLARLPRRVFTTDDDIIANVEIAHYGPAPMRHVSAAWKLVDERGKAVAKGALPKRDVPVGNGTELGQLRISANTLRAPAAYKLAVSVGGFENDWDIWIYPAKVAPAQPANVTITHELNDHAVAALRSGGRVLLLVPPSRVAPDPRLGKVALGFSSIFWNTAWTHGQPPHTLGILCDPRHPLFASFPTDSHSNWQWWYLVSRAGAMILDGLPGELQPPVQVIDDWVTNRRLALFLEAKVGAGRLAICSIDLGAGIETNIVARQFRQSLLTYVGGQRFNPKVAVTLDQVRGLISAPSFMDSLGARVAASSEQPGYEAGNAIDGNLKTIWHTMWEPGKPSHPHELRLTFNEPVAVRGFRVTPRQDRNRNGWINDYAIYAAEDGAPPSVPSSTDLLVAKGTLTRDDKPQTITLPKVTRARSFRFVAVSSFDAQPYASIAELEVLRSEVP